MITTEQRSLVLFSEKGNILEHTVLRGNERYEIKRKEKNLTPQQRRIGKYKSDLKKYSERLGGYINMCYVKNKLLFNELDIDRANISRLIYLSTYLDYNNRQENLLIKHTQCKVIEPLTRADIKKKLGLGDRAFINFMNDMKSNNLLFEAEGKFYISNDYFSKGDCGFKNKEYTRIFINTTRLLYENCNNRQHKQLSYAFQLVPYIHFETNILTSNPDAKEFSELQRIGLKDICNILELSTDKKAMSRLENDLLKLQITYNQEQFHLFKRVIVKGGNGKFDYFVINPQIVWSGRDTEKIKETIQLCFFQ